MNINLFELEPEKIYGLKANEDLKEQKIERCISSNDYVASLKKDGQYHRFVNYEGETKIQTRGTSVKTGTFGEVQDKVPHIYNLLKDIVPKNSLLIGELYYKNGTTNDVGSILRCLPARAISRQKNNPLLFYIHDVWYWDNENLMLKTKIERNEKLKEIEKLFKQNGIDADSYIEFARYVDTVEGIRSLMAYAFDNDEEGIVLTLKKSIVNPGTRTAWKTLKIKKELQNDVDVFLTGAYKEPTMAYTGSEITNWEYWINDKTGEKLRGKYYQTFLEGATISPITKPYFMGWPGSVEIAVLDDGGNCVNVGWLSGLTDEIKEDFARNTDKYTNKVCKINAMETTADYKFRHAKFIDFRDDISTQDCTFDKIFNRK